MARDLVIFHYPACGTCRKALKWLDGQGIERVAIDIVAQPPDRAALERWWRRSGLPLGRFFNTSGGSYREGGFKDRLATMSEAAQLDALAADGKLLKRPLLVAGADGADGVLVGFREAEWQALLVR